MWKFIILFIIIHELYFSRVSVYINTRILSTKILFISKYKRNSIFNEFKEDTIDSFQYQEILIQIKDLILVLGNWKNLQSFYLDAKCSLKDVLILIFIFFFLTLFILKN